MPEPVSIRRQATGAAVYLIGHGPLREPRLIELQHMRVRRYLHFLAEHEHRNFRIVSTFVDINHPRVSVRDSDALAKLPGLAALFGAIASGSIKTVLLDHAVEDLSDYFQPFRLEAAGVEVLNVCYEGSESLARAIRAGHGVPDGPSTPPREPEDFVTFFPAATARIASYLVDVWNPAPRSIQQLQERIAGLWSDNPYRFGREPRWSQRRQVDR